jgi:diadenylate cyclase
MPLLFKIGFLEFTWVDFADIFLVSLLLYQLYRLMKGSVAVRIFFGLLLIILIYLIVKAAKMELLTTILGQFTGVGVIAAIVLFQPEIRKFLLLVGKTTMFQSNAINRFFPWRRRGMNNTDLMPVMDAIKGLSASNTGALLVFSKNSELKFYAESGDILDADISKRLLSSIFFKNSPLHDGAVIIHGGKIKAARCVLPVSESEKIPAQLGLRHRAAVGMSEQTDTLVLSVSEETGEISIARHGRLNSNLSISEVRSRINKYLFDEEEEEGGKEVPLFNEEKDEPKESSSTQLAES